MSSRQLSAQQIDFISMIIDHLTHRGVVEPHLFFESPFIDQHPLGLAGLFPQDQDMTAIIDIVTRINDNARGQGPDATGPGWIQA